MNRSSEGNYKINLETLPWEATQKLHNHDRAMVGTDAYLGIAYFWHYKYRHTMRDASVYFSRVVHTKLLALGLPLDGDTPEHDKVMNWASSKVHGENENYS